MLLEVPIMDESRRKVLDMLAEGKISVDEAERLLAALERPPTTARRAGPKYGRATKCVCVVVRPDGCVDESDFRWKGIDFDLPGIRLNDLSV